MTQIDQFLNIIGGTFVLLSFNIIVSVLAESVSVFLIAVFI